MVRASDSGSEDPGSILGRVGVLFIIIIIIIKTLFKEEAQLDVHPIFPGVLI